MAISRKNKHRVLVDGKEYLWWVFDEVDQTEFDGIQIKIVAASQTHFFKYGLEQIGGDQKIVFALRDYAKLVHLACPMFENKNGIITKSGIIRLVEWCKNKEHKIIYALDGRDNNLNKEQELSLLEELQKSLIQEK